MYEWSKNRAGWSVVESSRAAEPGGDLRYQGTYPMGKLWVNRHTAAPPTNFEGDGTLHRWRRRVR